MIYYEKENTLVKLDTVESLDCFKDEVLAEDVRTTEDKKLLIFVVPASYEYNVDRTTYKVGFLYYFLKALYGSKMNNEDIYRRINWKYHIFIDSRQMQRYVHRFDTMPGFKTQ